MFSRYLVILLLFVAAALGPALLDTGTTAAPGPAVPDVPEEALKALEQGRYWRASRILREYLAAVPNPEPETILLAAQAEAGWGDWRRVERLLSGRPWLDTLAGGQGWNLLGRSWFEQGRWTQSGEALGRYLGIAATGADRDRGLAEARRGLALLRAERAGDAREALDRAAELIPELGDWLAVFAAQAAALEGDTAEVRRRLDAIDPYLALEWGWRIRVDGHRHAGDPRGARRAAEAAANALAAARRRTEAWLAAADLLIEEGDTATARNRYRRAMEAAPGAIAAVDAARKLSELPGLSAEDWLRIGRLYLRHGNASRAREGLEVYLDAGLGSPLERAQIRLEIARALFNQGRYAAAERRLLELAEESPSNRIGAESLYLAGRAQYRQGKEAAGRATFLRAAERFPHEPAAARAVFLIADLDHDDGRIDRAREHYRRAADIAPSINEAGLALMRLGGLAFIEGDVEGAARVFEEYRRLHPDGRRYQQATYWAAKAYEQLGNPGLAAERLRQARRADPLSWYGLRAAEELDAGFWDFALEPAPPEVPLITQEVAGALVRLDLLRELGQDEPAVFEVERLERHFADRDGASYALAEAFNARGYTLTGIRLGWEIHAREGAWNPRLLRIIYPFPYRSVIEAEAEERGLDPYLVAGLIRQESMFSATIRSPAGAVGLMQIMPATGRALASSLGVRSFETELLEQPEINIHLGTNYVAELLSRYDQRLTATLAAYNAGPNRVARWSSFPEFGDEELFAERIPYAETRHYVKVVQQNARVYAALYPAHTPGAAGPDE